MNCFKWYEGEKRKAGAKLGALRLRAPTAGAKPGQTLSASSCLQLELVPYAPPKSFDWQGTCSSTVRDQTTLYRRRWGLTMSKATG